MKEYHSIRELFEEADRRRCSPGVLACRKEAEEENIAFEEAWERMKRLIPVFEHAIRRGLADKTKSLSGMIGGDANRLYRAKMHFLSPVCRRACAYAIAAAEANAKMYRIVACPTAGSCGIVPAVLGAVGREIHASDDEYTRALFTAGAVGKVAAENASIAGVVDLLGGTTEQMGDALALGIKNLLGLACDPVAGLVEVPCVKRNGMDAVIALTAAEMALAGIHSVIPPDEVIDAMGKIGHLLPASLRETSQAGLAVTPTGRRITDELRRKLKNE